MGILVFVVVLVLLILVHEFGHFITAKWFKIRVDEFGIGFPPRLGGIKKGETLYSVNALPIGGFVRIFGEDPTETKEGDKDYKRSFIGKPRWQQAIVLVAGVVGNVLLAWLLFVIGFTVGLPVGATEENRASLTDVQVVIAQVLPDSPADKAGLMAGDIIVTLGSHESELDVKTGEEVSDFIGRYENASLSVLYERNGELLEGRVTPEVGINGSEEPLIGVSMGEVGIQKMNIFAALWHSVGFTLQMLTAITVALLSFIGSALLLTADFSQIAGPVGIATLVGDASAQGFVHLLSFTAIISLHLAVLNLLPFPALDGGRLVFVIVESVIRKQINPKVAQTINATGFVLLLILMVLVTYNDIVRLIT